MKAFKKIALAAGAALLTGAAVATPVNSVSADGAGQDLQSLLNGWVSVPGTAPNVNGDQYAPDEIWRIQSSSGSVAVMVFEVAGNASANAFGIYDVADKTNTLTLFGGPAGSGSRGTLWDLGSGQFVWAPLMGSNVSVTFDSANFGYFLSGPGGTFYSQAALNGGDDQMVAYQGQNQMIKWPYASSAEQWGLTEFLLAWEDQPVGAGDWDYNDMLVLVESVRSVPVPAPLALLGLGMLGMGVTLRRRAA